MNKYLPPLGIRKQTVQEQIAECQRMIYRNNIENLAFVKNNDKHKMVEVKTNNDILSEKLDLLFEELDSLEQEEA